MLVLPPLLPLPTYPTNLMLLLPTHLCWYMFIWLRNCVFLCKFGKIHFFLFFSFPSFFFFDSFLLFFSSPSLLSIPHFIFFRFTMPWSPTAAYKHPFAGMLPESEYTNRASFFLVDQLTYTGNMVNTHPTHHPPTPFPLL